MSDIIESSTENTQPPAPVQAEWGPEMDRRAHLQGYATFLRVTIALGGMTALVLLFMALFLT